MSSLASNSLHVIKILYRSCQIEDFYMTPGCRRYWPCSLFEAVGSTRRTVTPLQVVKQWFWVCDFCHSFIQVLYIYFFFYSRLNNWAFTTVNLKLGLPYRNEDILYGVHLPCLEITEEWLVLCLHFTVPESQDWTAISKRGHLYGAISWEIWRSICSLFLYLSL